MAAGYLYTAKARANFKTAYLVREEVVDASVSASCKVGDVVSIANEGTSSAIITPVVGTSASTSSAVSTCVSDAMKSAAAAISAGHLIIAQADQTMEYGHVKVEDRDYKYDPTVKSCDAIKKIAVFRIKDITDINKYAEYVGESDTTL